VVQSKTFIELKDKKVAGIKAKEKVVDKKITVAPSQKPREKKTTL
jgi:hypothetical protein